MCDQEVADSFVPALDNLAANKFGQWWYLINVMNIRLNITISVFPLTKYILIQVFDMHHIVTD